MSWKNGSTSLSSPSLAVWRKALKGIRDRALGKRDWSWASGERDWSRASGERDRSRALGERDWSRASVIGQERLKPGVGRERLKPGQQSVRLAECTWLVPFPFTSNFSWCEPWPNFAPLACNWELCLLQVHVVWVRKKMIGSCVCCFFSQAISAPRLFWHCIVVEIGEVR